MAESIKTRDLIRIPHGSRTGSRRDGLRATRRDFSRDGKAQSSIVIVEVTTEHGEKLAGVVPLEDAHRFAEAIAASAQEASREKLLKELAWAADHAEDAEASHGHADDALIAYLDEVLPEAAAAYRRVQEAAPYWACS